jgi:hypothetical protein
MGLFGKRGESKTNLALFGIAGKPHASAWGYFAEVG